VRAGEPCNFGNPPRSQLESGLARLSGRSQRGGGCTKSRLTLAAAAAAGRQAAWGTVRPEEAQGQVEPWGTGSRACERRSGSGGMTPCAGVR